MPILFILYKLFYCLDRTECTDSWGGERFDCYVRAIIIGIP